MQLEIQKHFLAQLHSDRVRHLLIAPEFFENPKLSPLFSQFYLCNHLILHQYFIILALLTNNKIQVLALDYCEC